MYIVQKEDGFIKVKYEWTGEILSKIDIESINSDREFCDWLEDILEQVYKLATY